ncbi:MAG TPA: hypothetical protein PLJ35_02165 [Anaerolineae bacterium]|nr:hypothetical protein [Anaerolineae bacterium]HOQ97609.1 hypothetical protein [Anaerolineae bacterium]HPL27382.1 hypothetical protein [Anaerolineae bacterium]
MANSQSEARHARWATLKAWRMELLFAVPIVTLAFYLFYTWFAVRNRYLIFLYFHDMGPGFDTTPFGWVTAGRYWMSGLVAGGAVLVPYIAANLALGRLRAYRAPVWWRLWLLCAIPLLVVIPAIVMTANDPVLPPANAAQVTGAALLGLALAVMLGRFAAERPLGLALLLIDGLALACLLTSLIRIESLSRWLAQGSAGFIYGLLFVAAAGVVLLAVTTALYGLWRRIRVPHAAALFVAGLDVAYLLLPLCHYLFWCSDDGTWTDPGYFHYISDAGNYFARSPALQTAVWVAVALVAWGVSRLRRWVRRRQMLAHRGDAS